MIYLLNILLLFSLNDLTSYNTVSSKHTEISTGAEQIKPCITAKIEMMESVTNNDEPVGQIGEGCSISGAWCAVEQTYDNVYMYWLPRIIYEGDPQITVIACRIPCSLHDAGNCPTP